VSDYCLFLDDTRKPPDDGGTWVVCRTVEALRETVKARGAPKQVSFDYELGNTDPTNTGYDALNAFLDSLESLAPTEGRIEVRAHSSSSQGRVRIRERFEERQAALKAAGIDAFFVDTDRQIEKYLKGTI